MISVSYFYFYIIHPASTSVFKNNDNLQSFVRGDEKKKPMAY